VFTKIITIAGAGTEGDPARLIGQCSTAQNGISYFAFRLSDGSDMFKTFLSTLTSAKLGNRPVEIYYDPNDTSGNNWGCGSANCRRIKQLRMQ
jgi:hypothetical protein